MLYPCVVHSTVTYAQLICISHLFYDLNEAPKCHSNADSPDWLQFLVASQLGCGIHKASQGHCEATWGEATLIRRQLISKQGRQSKARTQLMSSIKNSQGKRRQVQQNRFPLAGRVAGATLVPPVVLITPIVRYSSSDMLVFCTLLVYACVLR